MSNDLDARLEEVFAAALNTDSVHLADDMTAVDIDGMDSLAVVNLMFLLEEEFGVQFLGDELAGMRNVGELKAYLLERATP
jgi:acyl carrier protein